MLWVEMERERERERNEKITVVHAKSLGMMPSVMVSPDDLINCTTSF